MAQIGGYCFAAESTRTERMIVKSNIHIVAENRGWLHKQGSLALYVAMIVGSIAGLIYVLFLR